MRQRVKAFQRDLALHGGSHLYHVLRVVFVLSFVFHSSFKPNNVAYITANRLNFTVMELDSVYLIAFMAAIVPQMDLSQCWNRSAMLFQDGVVFRILPMN